MSELFKLAHRENISMVHHIDFSWNTIEPSVLLMYKKLLELGFVYRDGEIVVFEPEDSYDF